MPAYSSSDLFDRLVAVGFTRGMSTEKERLGFAMVKAHETVLPIPDVVAKADVENDIAQVEAVEIEPESIDNAIAFLNDQQYSGRIATTSGLFDMDGLATIPLAEFLLDIIAVTE